MRLQKNLSRRAFLQSSATVGSGLIIGFYLPPAWRKAMAQPAEPPTGPGKVFPPNAFIRITPANSVEITINKLEMGQGVFTSMAQLIAEELDCDWKNVASVSAPVASVYNHTMMPTQMTGGSSSLASSYEQYRNIGATARALLVQAAAKKWRVTPESCRTENGFVVHDKKGRLAYGELSEAAAKLPTPKDVKLKDPAQFKIIGKSMSRVDSAAKVNGSAIYGLDVRIPGMLYVVMARPPVFGATLGKFDAAPARAVAGVVDVVQVGNSIAVLAKNTWAARNGRDSLRPEWNTKGKDKFSHETLMAQFKKFATTPSIIVKDNQDAVKKVKSSARVLKAQYEFPFLAHACMEPLNCTVNYDGKSAELWSGHQLPTADQGAAAKVLDLPPEKVKVNTVYAGGSFGRRGSKVSDYVVEACAVAKLVKKPIQVVWTREDDMRGGFYRPMNFHSVRIATDAKGMPEAWHHTVVGQSIFKGSFFEGMMAGKPVDPVVVEGVADTPYKIPAFHMDLEMPTLDIPTLWWRSVGHSHTAFVMETLIDELAAKAKIDPLKYRQNLLKESPRHLAVLDLLARKTPWGKSAPKGHAYGLAIHESFNSVVGHVAEVSLNGSTPKVHKVWSAVHCGRVINPDGARTQIESAIVYGLSAALYGQIKFAEGKVITSNFSDYNVMRMSEMPPVEVHFVETNEPPTGLGEPGLPPIAPAVANAMFRLSGKRVRKLPMG